MLRCHAPNDNYYRFSYGIFHRLPRCVGTPFSFDFHSDWRSTSTTRTLAANPSAVSGYDETYADLLNQESGNYEYMSDNSGRVHTYQYHGPTGYLTAE